MGQRSGRRPTLVFETRVAAAHRLLLDQADLPAEPAQLELAEVDAVEEQRAALRVVEALEQPADRRLAGAALADEGDHRPGRRDERDPLEHRRVGRVRVVEADVTQLDGAAAGGRRVADAKGDRRLALEQLEEAADRDERLGQAHVHVGERREALLVQRHIHVERDEAADG